MNGQEVTFNEFLKLTSIKMPLSKSKLRKRRRSKDFRRRKRISKAKEAARIREEGSESVASQISSRRPIQQCRGYGSKTKLEMNDNGGGNDGFKGTPQEKIKCFVEVRISRKILVRIPRCSTNQRTILRILMELNERCSQFGVISKFEEISSSVARRSGDWYTAHVIIEFDNVKESIRSVRGLDGTTINGRTIQVKYIRETEGKNVYFSL